MVLSSRASSPSSSPLVTLARTARSPSPSRRAVWPTTDSGRSTRTVSADDAISASTRPTTDTAISSSLALSASRCALSLLRIIASWLVARMPSAASLTARNSTSSVVK